VPVWAALRRSGLIAESLFFLQPGAVTAGHVGRWIAIADCDLAPGPALNHAPYRYTWMDARILYDIEHKKK
jgi:hypothetical protein